MKSRWSVFTRVMPYLSGLSNGSFRSYNRWQSASMDCSLSMRKWSWQASRKIISIEKRWSEREKGLYHSFLFWNHLLEVYVVHYVPEIKYSIINKCFCQSLPSIFFAQVQSILVNPWWNLFIIWLNRTCSRSILLSILVFVCPTTFSIGQHLSLSFIIISWLSNKKKERKKETMHRRKRKWKKGHRLEYTSRLIHIYFQGIYILTRSASTVKLHVPSLSLSLTLNDRSYDWRPSISIFVTSSLLLSYSLHW